MGTHRLYEMKRFHRFDMPEAHGRLTVTALNLFRPTAFSSLRIGFFHIVTQSPGDGYAMTNL